MNWIQDPRIFNYLLIGLQLLAAGRWMAAGNVNQTFYWLGASIVVYTVTRGMR